MIEIGPGLPLTRSILKHKIRELFVIEKDINSIKMLETLKVKILIY